MGKRLKLSGEKNICILNFCGEQKRRTEKSGKIQQGQTLEYAAGHTAV